MQINNLKAGFSQLQPCHRQARHSPAAFSECWHRTRCWLLCGLCHRALVWLPLPVLTLAGNRKTPVEVPIVLQIQETACDSSFMTQLRDKSAGTH